MTANRVAGTPPHMPAPAGSGWTAGRVIALVAGSVLLMISLGLLAGGGALAWADEEQHHSGYVTVSTGTYSTQGYALASDAISLHGIRGWLSLFVDKVRIRVSSESPRPLFAGVAPAGVIDRYLAGAAYTKVGTQGEQDIAARTGAGVPAPPASALPWAERAQGSGNLTLTWPVQDGDWTVVVMNVDASPGLTVRADAGISSLALSWLAGELLAGGVLLGVAALALIIVPVRLASRPA